MLFVAAIIIIVVIVNRVILVIVVLYLYILVAHTYMLYATCGYEFAQWKEKEKSIITIFSLFPLADLLDIIHDQITAAKPVKQYIVGCLSRSLTIADTTQPNPNPCRSVVGVFPMNNTLKRRTKENLLLHTYIEGYRQAKVR